MPILIWGWRVCTVRWVKATTARVPTTTATTSMVRRRTLNTECLGRWLATGITGVRRRVRERLNSVRIQSEIIKVRNLSQSLVAKIQ